MEENAREVKLSKVSCPNIDPCGAPHLTATKCYPLTPCSRLPKRSLEYKFSSI